MSSPFKLQWFPGHMAKARRRLTDQLRQVEFVVEVIDARAPFSTHNPDLNELAKDRPRLIVLAKADLADPSCISHWQKTLNNRRSIAANLTDPSDIREVRRAVIKTSKLHQQGRRAGPQSAAPLDVPGLKLPSSARRRRGMVVGMPNTGKSTLIKALGGRGVTTGARAGVTRSIQWVNVGSEIALLDTPGMMWPKAETGNTALYLAWLGCVGDAGFDTIEAGKELIRWLVVHKPQALIKRYQLQNDALEESAPSFLNLIALRRGHLGPEGRPDKKAAAQTLLSDLRAGRFGPLCFDPSQKPSG